MHPRSRTALGVVLLGCALAGCGGGGGGGGAAPPNANLAALAPSAGTLSPAFSANTLAYAVAAGLDEDAVTLTPTGASVGATITVAGAATPSGAPSVAIPLGLGPTPVAVVVTAADGTTVRTYVVVFTRGPSVQEAYVKPDVVGMLDRFGTVVALAGDTLVVGAPREASSVAGVDGDPTDDSLPLSGAAYVFVRTGGTWAQQAYLKASNPGASDDFGASVAVHGDTVVVGAPREGSSATGVDGNGALDDANFSGAAYVFVRSGVSWRQQAYLKADDTSPNVFFGTSVSVSGDTVVVGAPRENGGISNSGAAYVFVRSGNTWSQQAQVKASNPGNSDLFGTSVALSGQTLVVGAPGEDSASTGVNGDEADDGAPFSGAAYVFVRSGIEWKQDAYLKASNTGAGDEFGLTVAIDGFTVVVGAPFEDSATAEVDGPGTDDRALESGAAYVFARGPSNWAEQAYLKPSNTGAGDQFGTSVAVSGDVVVVGSPFEDSAATGIDGDPFNEDLQDPGAVFAFARTGTTWEQASYLKPAVTGPADVIGLSVAVSGGTIAFGAFGEDGAGPGVNSDPNSGGAPTSGAAYVLR